MPTCNPNDHCSECQAYAPWWRFPHPTENHDLCKDCLDKWFDDWENNDCRLPVVVTEKEDG